MTGAYFLCRVTYEIISNNYDNKRDNNDDDCGDNDDVNSNDNLDDDLSVYQGTR